MVQTVEQPADNWANVTVQLIYAGHDVKGFNQPYRFLTVARDVTTATITSIVLCIIVSRDSLLCGKKMTHHITQSYDNVNYK